MKEHRGYCFDCQKEFVTRYLTAACPYCNGENWWPEPKALASWKSPDPRIQRVHKDTTELTV